MLTLTCKDICLFLLPCQTVHPIRIDIRKDVLEPERFSEALFHELGLCQAACPR